jgi:hypothetical protein
VLGLETERDCSKSLVRTGWRRMYTERQDGPVLGDGETGDADVGGNFST